MNVPDEVHRDRARDFLESLPEPDEDADAVIEAARKEARDEVHLDVDPMLFYAMVIEDEMELIGVFDGAMGMLGMPADVTAGVSGIAREKIEEAQAQLDLLIAEDTTWRPA